VPLQPRRLIIAAAAAGCKRWLGRSQLNLNASLTLVWAGPLRTLNYPHDAPTRCRIQPKPELLADSREDHHTCVQRPIGRRDGLWGTRSRPGEVEIKAANQFGSIDNGTPDCGEITHRLHHAGQFDTATDQIALPDAYSARATLRWRRRNRREVPRLRTVYLRRSQLLPQPAVCSVKNQSVVG
jgi:hypothetical protein